MRLEAVIQYVGNGFMNISTDDQHWGRLFTNGADAVGFFLLSLIFFSWYIKKALGHKFLLGLITFNLVLRGIWIFSVGYSSYTHWLGTPSAITMYLHVAATIAFIWLIYYIVFKYQDIYNTLDVSERIDRELTDIENDNAQVESNVDYMADASLKKTHELLVYRADYCTYPDCEHTSVFYIYKCRLISLWSRCRCKWDILASRLKVSR